MSAEDDFADLKFKIECSEMVLTRTGANGLVVRGPGEVWQNDEGILQFKMFALPEGYRGVLEYSFRQRTVGRLLPDEDFFTLEAQDFAQRRWISPRVLPGCRGGHAQGMVCGRLQELVRTEIQPFGREHCYIRLLIKGKLVFPCNQGTENIIRIGGVDRQMSNTLNVAFIEDGDYHFEIAHEGEHSVISLQLPADQATSSTPSRIHESLQFVLGRQLAIMVVETNAGNQSNIRLVSALDRDRGQLPPPLLFHQLDQGGFVWRMFMCYFRHVHALNQIGWHPISRHIGSAIESSAASIDAAVLALAVAVEGLVGECFPNLVPANPEFLSNLDNALAALQNVALSESTRNRINGSLNAMRRPRNSDVLHAFIAARNLTPCLYESWSRLRNAAAHGGGTGGREIIETLELRDEVLFLFYSIVFAAINYSGQRTDYSVMGCPQAVWPILQQNAQPNATI